jgi:hypothetical protein
MGGTMFTKKIQSVSPGKTGLTAKWLAVFVLLPLILFSSGLSAWDYDSESGVRLSTVKTVPDFDMTAYKSFLAAHQDMSTRELLSLHPAGVFEPTAPTDYSAARYFRSLDSLYSLTADEKTLLGRHGFVVTDRIRPMTFAGAFDEIYRNDMPLFISTDAILHALHMSYDKILMTVEQGVMIPWLTDALSKIHAQLSVLAARYTQEPEMKPALTDVDLYLTVAQRLLGRTIVPLYPSTLQASDDILGKIAAEQWVKGTAPLFGDSIRLVDYSQFTVRGHYIDTYFGNFGNSGELSKYFQAMMWLGRTEFYLSPPKNTMEQYTEAQIQRQVIAALLLKEAVELSGAETKLGKMDDILRFFVGDPDNVTLEQLRGLADDLGITGADDMLDTLKLRSFQSALLEHSWAYQRIVSQMLCSDPMTPDQVQPASSFLLMGQRFIIDSYVTGNVVFDRVPSMRMLPSTQDVLFALGNDASAQLLVPELDYYHYTTNLAALRYLIDSYEPGFWATTFYNGWLNAIRSLNPPQQRDGLPAYMRTAAWWQEKMNTQLASWAELRHDNLLYAKQSYTIIGACAYPCAYVEPVPEFYRQIASLADTAAAYFRDLSVVNLEGVISYFGKMKLIAETLKSIAEKELSGVELAETEQEFLSRTIRSELCGSGGEMAASGWYPDLYFNTLLLTNDYVDRNIVVADVHTSPSDESGNMVGWVLHAGTGPLNMAFIVTDWPQTGPVMFAGPVMSYHEKVTDNFKRLTDEEWKEQYAGLTSTRPAWVNLYLTDESGQMLGEGQRLVSSVPFNPSEQDLPGGFVLAQNYPNPFNPATIIEYDLPKTDNIRLAIYDLLGRQVKILADVRQPAGHYRTTWDGTDDGHLPVSAGLYFCRMEAGDFVKTIKLALVR